MSTTRETSIESAVAGVDDGPEFQRSLTAVHVGLIVVAAAAPLSSMVGNVPVGIILGDGVGLPVIFLIAGLVVSCLAVGYMAMNRALPDAGGFAGFVRAGLGPSAGLGAAYATALSYGAGAVSLAAATGYFGSLIADALGARVPWWAVAFVALGLTAMLGRRAADLSAKVLLGLMFAEFAILAVLDVLILAQRGLAALPAVTFTPHAVFSGHLGPALMVGFTSFIGIESAILYTREVRDPERAIPKATYASVAGILVFYVLTCWLIIGGAGVDTAKTQATAAQGEFVFTVAQRYGGPALVTVMQIFFFTSLIACLIALHNATVRYLYTLAHQGDLPAPLAAVHLRHGSPHRASDAMAIVTAVVLALAALSRVDPYLGVCTSLTGLFTVGIVGVQVVVAVATVAFFWRHPDRHPWKTLAAPVIGGLGVLAAVVSVATNYSTLTLSSSPIVNSLPLLIVAALVAGPIVLAVRRRRAGAAPDAVTPAAEAVDAETTV